MGSRSISSSHPGSNRMIRNVLESVFAAELIHPSAEFWIVSPWLSNVPIIDNHSGGFTGTTSTWGRRDIRLVELLSHFIVNGTGVHIVLRPRPANQWFIDDLAREMEKYGFGENECRVSECEDLHRKGVASSTFYLSGSLNITHNALYILDEQIRLTDDPSEVNEALIEFRNAYE